MKQKDPFLTGFSHHLFGSARRCRQVQFQQKSRQLGASSLGDLALLFDPVLPHGFMRAASNTKRIRHYDDLSTFWAWTGQILEKNASCSKAVSLVQSWRADLGLSVPSSRTASYCTARSRLDEGILDKVLARINDTMGQRIGEADRWHGHILKAIDGSSVKLMDTQQNQKTYPQPSVQKEGCGFPVMGICGVLNLSHGGWQAITAYPHREHDLTPSYDLLDCFGQGDLVLADRAFCSYELTALLNQRGAHSLMRLHQSRERSLDWRKGKRIGKNQRLITWSKPSRRDGSKLTREQWDALPGKLEVRYIRFSYRDRSGQRKQMVLG